MQGQSEFLRAFAATVGHEGGYSNNPNDLGGKTIWGITEAVARANGYMGDISKMSIEIAQRIYYTQYWEKLLLNEVSRMSEPLAAELFDTGVNMGIATAVMMLQQVLNAFNNQGEYYPDLFEDGVIGKTTIAALHAYYAKRGPKGGAVLLKTLNSLQCARYIELTRKRQKNEAFVFGWIANRVSLASV